MANLATEVLFNGDAPLILLVVNESTPSDDEWGRYLSVVAPVVKARGVAGLTLSDGGGPNAAQRDRMRKAIGGVEPLSAVVTGEVMVRGIVKALQWFNPNIVAYAPGEIEAALSFARVSPGFRASAWKRVVELDRQLLRPTRVVAAASLALSKAGAARPEPLRR